jgi:hypothetical protein
LSNVNGTLSPARADQVLDAVLALDQRPLRDLLTLLAEPV